MVKRILNNEDILHFTGFTITDYDKARIVQALELVSDVENVEKETIIPLMIRLGLEYYSNFFDSMFDEGSKFENMKFAYDKKNDRYYYLCNLDDNKIEED